MIKLERIQTFIVVVESHSFSAAAQKLKISVPAVSKQITGLESELKAQLLKRTTRRLSLTEFGQIYYEQCRRLMLEVQETENVSSSLNDRPSGVLKAFIARHFAETYILPHLGKFQKLYPQITLDLELGERMPDPTIEPIDLIFGVSMGGPLNWVQKKISTTRYVYCASSAYLAQFGTPKKPTDLLEHHYISHSMRRPKNTLEFSQGDSLQIVPFMTLNDTRAMLQCALNDLGIVQLHEYVVQEAINSQCLIEILSQFVKPSIPIYIYYPEKRFMPLKVKKFIEFFSEQISTSNPLKK